MKTKEKQTYKVVDIIKETSQVTTLILAPKPQFIPGQYITVYFPQSGTPEGKAYSISSSPSQENFSITVKAMGEFSNRLSGLRVGDSIEGSLPYGFFYSETSDNDFVFIASGIGIAPFRSMALSNPKRKIILHYSTKKKEDALFKKEFAQIKNVDSTFYFTQEGSSRINPTELILNLPKLQSPEFFICGSIAFVRDMWTGLKNNGVPEEKIYTEAFF